MKVLRVAVCIVLVACCILTFTFVKGKLNQSEVEKSQAQYQGVLTIYHVETFEGGVGSRKQFLLRSARTFEKKNKGVLIMVVSHTKHSLESALKSGQIPDMISFGSGVNLKSVREIGVKNSVLGGKVGQKDYATAWAKGGYVLIANANLVNEIPNEIDELIVSQNDYTQPMTALLLEGITVKNVKIKQPMDAYVSFTSNKVKYFLATQRDICRLESRDMNIISKPLKEYNDLYQYICVTSADENRSKTCENFINHLISESEQKKLKEINLLSPFYSVEFENEHLLNMQKVKERFTQSAFITQEEIIEMQNLSLSALLGDDNSKNKIKNMVLNLEKIL